MRVTTRAAVLVGATLALLPAACGLGSDGNGADELDPSESTVFRTITVAIDTVPTTTVVAAVGEEGAAPVGPSSGVYVVKAGDYWYLIAQRLGVDVERLLAANGMDLDSLLVPGQELQIPGAAPAPGATETASTTAAGATSGTAPPVAGAGGAVTTLATDGSEGIYKIQKGDFWVRIAERVGVPLDELLAANGADADTVLIPGEYIRVPPKSG